MKSLKLAETADQPLESLLHSFFGRPFFTENSDRLMMRVDVSEDEGTYTINAEMPGIKKEDIQVSVEGNQVSIRAETRKEEERKQDGKLLHQECFYGSLYRSFSLDQPVDDAKAAATYKDGVLKLVLPKSTTSTVRRLAIQ